MAKQKKLFRLKFRTLQSQEMSAQYVSPVSIKLQICGASLNFHKLSLGTMGKTLVRNPLLESNHFFEALVFLVTSFGKT